jgi:hypothetical protein
MWLKKSVNNLQLFYARLNTVPDFTRVARRFALIRKAIAEIKAVEDIFLSGPVTDDDYRTGLQDMIDFSGIVESEVDKAIARVILIRKNVRGYKKELVSAIG